MLTAAIVVEAVVLAVTVGSIILTSGSPIEEALIDYQYLL